MNDTVTATGRSAGGEAGVGVLVVAVIAALVILHDTVTATGGGASSAVIGRVVVAVITPLTRPHHAITTPSVCAAV